MKKELMNQTEAVQASMGGLLAVELDELRLTGLVMPRLWLRRTILIL